MSAMNYDRNDHPRLSNSTQTMIAADGLQQENQLEEALYPGHDTLLDDDFLEQSLDDYDDLVAAAEDDNWDDLN